MFTAISRRSGRRTENGWHFEAAARKRPGKPLSRRLDVPFSIWIAEAEGGHGRKLLELEKEVVCSELQSESAALGGGRLAGLLFGTYWLDASIFGLG